MKYINARNAIPEQLLKQIMEYVDGQYIYIPKKILKTDICLNVPFSGTSVFSLRKKIMWMNFRNRHGIILSLQRD